MGHTHYTTLACLECVFSVSAAEATECIRLVLTHCDDATLFALPVTRTHSRTRARRGVHGVTYRRSRVKW